MLGSIEGDKRYFPVFSHAGCMSPLLESLAFTFLSRVGQIQICPTQVSTRQCHVMWLLIIVAFLQTLPFRWVWDQWFDGQLATQLVQIIGPLNAVASPYKRPDGTRWHFGRMLQFRITPSQKMVGQLPYTCQKNYQAYLCTSVKSILQQ